MQRRVEEANRHRQPAHGLEDRLEVGLLERKEPVEGRATRRFVEGEDHLLHDREPLLPEEHVLRPAEPDPFRAELAGAPGVDGCVGIRANAELAGAVGPREDRLEISVRTRLDERRGTKDDPSRRAVDGQLLALPDLVTADRADAVLLVDLQRVAAGDAGLAHPARNHGCVRSHPSVGGENALRSGEPVDVVGSGVEADEDDGFVRTPFCGDIGVEDDRADGGAWRRRQADPGNVDRRGRIHHWMQHVIERGGLDSPDRLVARDQLFARHVDGRLQRGGGSPLRRPSLQDVEPSLLDRELDILHVTVMPLEHLHRRAKLRIGVREKLLELVELLRCTNAGHHILALRVDEELAEQLSFARRRVA